MTLHHHCRRPGAAMVEAAIVMSVMVLILFGIIVGGVGVFHHQQVGCLSREAARWASTRGADREADTDTAPPSALQIVDAAVRPRAVGMDPAALTVTVEWIDQGTGAAQDWDASPKEVRSITAGGEYVSNSVRVTVRYNWEPGVVFGPVAMSSVCVVPMTH